ncbi:PhzF family phenazine biosynthesis protein [Variovorax sp. J22R115]|uniref:PhzF family phenazine biosynthesis protein n=1 Tax=Variovorax sp. J22R115 TaxID=3053509 RepID=UPI0025777CFE|nr:PhzF family phenazine biosynthesis protein [Variovorax sp. J22R115]MDM0053694.1 PhzF family phenazine biosynthesis protein [Variovorax sp. J22R115]
MTNRPFKQVDVFTSTPYFGNPLAVVLDGTGLDDAEMQRFAKWTNLSETTFLLPPTEPTADYRVRIFTPGGELPFAGHPTLGSCHAWLQAGGKPKSGACIVQQCAQGLVLIQREGERLVFAAPPLRRSAPSPTLLAKVAAALGLKAQQITAAQLLDNGPVWLGLLLEDADTVLALKPDHRMLRELGQKVGVAGIWSTDDSPPLIVRSNREARAFARTEEAPAGIEVRVFAAPVGIEEDPVTGSFNASLAQWLIADGQMPERYVAAQGQTLGRSGRVHVTRDADGQVWVGGSSVTCIDGTVAI